MWLPSFLVRSVALEGKDDSNLHLLPCHTVRTEAQKSHCAPCPLKCFFCKKIHIEDSHKGGLFFFIVVLGSSVYNIFSYNFLFAVSKVFGMLLYFTYNEFLFRKEAVSILSVNFCSIGSVPYSPLMDSQTCMC